MPKIDLNGAPNLVVRVQNVIVRGIFSKIGAKNDEFGVINSAFGVRNTDAGVLRSKKPEFGTLTPAFLTLISAFFARISELFDATMQFRAPGAPLFALISERFGTIFAFFY